MLGSITNIRQSIALVALEGLDDITVSIADLVTLERYIKEREQKISEMEMKLVALNIQLSNTIAESINMKCPDRLDKYV